MDITLFFIQILQASWQLFVQSASYMLFGLLIGGMLKIFLSADYVAKHLGRGRFSSVFKASLLGVPIPLCSCGVLPAAASLKKQGANKGATAAFLISTPESGVDSISITYALLDPIMTIARPVSAFISAMAAGIGVNLLQTPSVQQQAPILPQAFQADCGCSGTCTTSTAKTEEGIPGKLVTGLRYAAIDI